MRTISKHERSRRAREAARDALLLAAAALTEYPHRLDGPGEALVLLGVALVKLVESDPDKRALAFAIEP